MGEITIPDVLEATVMKRRIVSVIPTLLGWIFEKSYNSLMTILRIL